MENIEEIFTDKIHLPKDNMRQHIDRDEIFELAEDIKKNGLIQPITVRPYHIACSATCAKGPQDFSCTDSKCQIAYELVAGQRRYLAHQVAGILKIKCIVKKLSDEEAFAIMTSENLARVDVNPVDEAKHIAKLLEYNNGDINKVSDIVRRSVGWVKDRLLVAKMPEWMQEYLAKKEIKLGVALVLSQITDEQTCRVWTDIAIRDGASVAMAEYWFADWKRQELPGGIRSDTPPEGFIPGAPQPTMFTCAIDGKRYDTRMIKSILIYEGNLDYFNAFVAAFREPPSENELSPGGN